MPPPYSPLSPAAFEQTPKLPVVLVLDNIRSMHNVGAAFRLGDVFAIEKIYLCGITATPPHRAIHQVALGAEKTVNWAHLPTTTSCLAQLQAAGHTLLAIEQTPTAQDLRKFVPTPPPSRYALVFGNEVFGVAPEVLEQCASALEIPQYGTKQSLNVATSMGIVLWEFNKHLRSTR